jgi:hypothetical protein
VLSVLVGVLRGARDGATAAVKRAVLVGGGGGGAITCQVGGISGEGEGRRGVERESELCL